MVTLCTVSLFRTPSSTRQEKSSLSAKLTREGQGRAGQGRWPLLRVPPLRPVRCHSRTSWDRELMQLCGSGQCAGCWPGFCEPGHLVDKACVLVPKIILDTALIHLFLLPKRHFAAKKKKKKVEEGRGENSHWGAQICLPVSIPSQHGWVPRVASGPAAVFPS